MKKKIILVISIRKTNEISLSFDSSHMFVFKVQTISSFLSWNCQLLEYPVIKILDIEFVALGFKKYSTSS